MILIHRKYVVLSAILFEKNQLLSMKNFNGSRVLESLEDFKKMSDIIIANRVTDEIGDIKGKLYTSDLFKSD